MKEQKTLSWAESGGALPMLHLHLQFKNYLRQSVASWLLTLGVVICND